ncbi:hypothetical protein NFHSH190041_25270 [Shewanella sp. NFH-SH190041]|uniref:hypothetical protein n=1 Tax=Shewanella sp. NFH-SH190041 TaxID=2950245 RepID=UPI0021C309CB|nr:hypothetical protein [Shewanella sp. NFH-SH190041]BDM65075.1 hypothetical protein NFHSH190041_25270 [Shewanella sp. NFH-SH190041]
MRLRLVAAFVGISAVVLTITSVQRDGAGLTESSYLSLATELDRFNGESDTVTAMSLPSSAQDTMMLSGESYSGASR